MRASASRSCSADGSSAVGSDAEPSMIASSSAAGPIRAALVVADCCCRRGSVLCDVQHRDELFQADARHQLHAQQPLVEIRIDLFGKHLHDVLMLEPGHRAAFAAAIGRDLERDQPIERHLPGQVDVAERAAAQHADDFEVVDLRAGQQRHRRHDRADRSLLDGVGRRPVQVPACESWVPGRRRFGEDDVRDAVGSARRDDPFPPSRPIDVGCDVVSVGVADSLRARIVRLPGDVASRAA